MCILIKVKIDELTVLAYFYLGLMHLKLKSFLTKINAKMYPRNRDHFLHSIRQCYSIAEIGLVENRECLVEASMLIEKE